VTPEFDTFGDLIMLAKGTYLAKYVHISGCRYVPASPLHDLAHVKSMHGMSRKKCSC
jgi:hypothetical protein